MIHELAVGVSPFPQSDEIATALHHQLNTAPVPLDEVDPSIPAPFAAAVERALHKDPQQRFSSVRDFAAAAAAESVAGDKERHRRQNMALSIIGIVLAVAAMVFALWPDGAAEVAELDTEVAQVEPAPVTNPAAGLWRAGDAAALACNLLVGHDFENGSVPLDFFGDPPARERVVDTGGYEDSWALEVGIANDFGQYAETVPISDDESYRFQGWFSINGDVEAARIGITVLNDAFEKLEPEVWATLRPGPGFSQVEFTDLPAGAAFALPWIFKDSSPGVLLADELVFGQSGACAAEIAGS